MAGDAVGIGEAAFTFLGELAENNTRGWFLANAPRYERDVVLPFRRLLADLISILAARDIPLTGIPAKALFRIHRDVRFSHNKLPYKTHAGAVLTHHGSKAKSGLLYIHIDPAGCFVAAGFWQPQKEALGALREAIYTETKQFCAVQAGLAAAGLSFDDSESLVRMPRGYEDAVDTEIGRVLRLKSFVVRRALTHATLASPSGVADIAGFAADALPWLQFGWNALTVLEPKRTA